VPNPTITYKKGTIKKSKRLLFWLIPTIVAAGFALFHVAFKVNAFVNSKPEYAEQLGSFVGGIFGALLGALFAFISVLLLYFTLRGQQRSATEQTFETKYFELLKMHRDNVSEIGIKGGGGRKLFVFLVRELRCILAIVRKVSNAFDQRLCNEELLKISYYCLFFGVGPNSSRMLKMALAELNYDSGLINAVEGALNDPKTKVQVMAERNFSYLPFEGHQSRLGHYYRHLYQMVQYVDQNAPGDESQKYAYAKTIRAQLSTHEQALLLVNSRTPMGRNWWNKNWIVKYRLVKNIPREFFDSATELDASTLFPRGYFEYESPNYSG
jgi:hypothetical protein